MKRLSLFLNIVALSACLLLSACDLADVSPASEEASSDRAIRSSMVSVYTATTTCAAPQPDLVSWWGGDGSVEDLQGENDATLVNGATYSAGKVDLAFEVLGTTDHVRIADAPDLNLTGDLTLEAWISLPEVTFGSPNSFGVGGDRAIIDKRDDADALWTYTFFIEGDAGSGIGVGTAPLRFEIATPSRAAVLSGILTWVPDTWYHVAVTKSGSTVTLYRDGVVVGTGFVGLSAVATPGSRLALGAIPTAGGVFNPLVGYIDEPSVYDQALSDTEIVAIYDADSAGKCKVIEVAVDIKPGSVQNPINLRSRGVIPVAILTDTGFDATAVDPLSVAFGPAEAAESHGKGHVEDVDDDGDLDLLLHFRTQETGITAGDTEACLSGETFTGQSIEGCDYIRPIGG